MLNHAQTIAIVGSLQLAWPSSSSGLMSVLSLDYVQASPAPLSHVFLLPRLCYNLICPTRFVLPHPCYPINYTPLIIPHPCYPIRATPFSPTVSVNFVFAFWVVLFLTIPVGASRMPHQRRRQLLLPLLDHPGRALTANTCSHLLEPLPPDSSQPNSPSFSRPVFAHMSHAIILGGDADRVAPSAPGARRPPAGDTAAAPARAGEVARRDRG